MTGPRTWKSVADLTLDDLRVHPVWEFALREEGEDEQDETTVRPYTVVGELDPAEGTFVVRAKFTLFDGTEAEGYLAPPHHGETCLGTSQPVIVTASGQVAFWCGVIVPPPAAIQACYLLLGKSGQDDVFPLHFESAVPLIGAQVAGTIPGFIVLTDWKTMTTRVVR